MAYPQPSALTESLNSSGIAPASSPWRVGFETDAKWESRLNPLGIGRTAPQATEGPVQRPALNCYFSVAGGGFEPPTLGL
jgi:hypothetical protein